MVLYVFHFGNSFAAEQNRSIDALIIYGNAGIAAWEQGFNARLREQLGPDLGLFFTPEFLSLGNASPQEQQLIAQSLAIKYSGREFDLIVPVLPEANMFFDDYGELFVGEVDVFRVLPGSVTLARGHRASRTTVLPTMIPQALQDTLDVVPDLLPELKHLLVVGGSSLGDRQYMELYRNTLINMEQPYELHFLAGLTPEELLIELKTFPPDTAIISTTYDMDRLGRQQHTTRIVERITENFDFPIFAMTNTQLPYGALGGAIATIEGYASSASQFINGILDGDIPEASETMKTEHIYNGEQLDRFGINRNLLPEGSTIVNDIPNLWRDYSRWLLLAVSVIAVQAILILSLLQARSRRRLAEERLSRASKMEALGTLAGGIAHDFNNILMSIMANAELIQLGSPKDEETGKKVSKILSASDRAKNLISQILLYSRQGVSNEKKPVDLFKVVTEATEQIRTFIPSSCKISISGDPQLPAISGDWSQLDQVITNLCVNAQQALAAEGTIDIHIAEENLETPQPALSLEVPPGKYVTVLISDNGSGIEPANLSKIFEPFFTTKAHGEGTGLGLSLAYQIIKNHNGFIHVDSEPGKGTDVKVYFPVMAELATQQFASTKTPSFSIGNDESILLVDDDELVLDANLNILLKLGYQVSPFSSSLAALKHFGENPNKYDLIFTDLSMPGMDGLRLVSNIRRERSDLPAIICTGFREGINPNELENIKVLTKPSSAAEISDALKAELSQRHTSPH